MNSFLRSTIIALMLLAFGAVNAQYASPSTSYGIGVGGAYGDNNGNDESWSPRVKFDYQFRILNPVSTQLGLSYTTLHGGSGYGKTKTVAGDIRFLLRPISFNHMYPFLYAGAGVAKNLNTSNSDFLPLIPIGFGVQTPLGDELMLQFSGGYNLVLSDALDGIDRSDSDLNRFTNKKHDGFFEIMVGLSFGNAKKEKPVEPEKQVVVPPKEVAPPSITINVTPAPAVVTPPPPVVAPTPAVVTPPPPVVAPPPPAVVKEVEPQMSKSDIDKLVADAVKEAMKDKGKKVVLHGITFETNKSLIRQESSTILEIVREAMAANPDVTVVITGHTDSVGDAEYNRNLSLERAQAVKDWLVRNNIRASRMKVVGKGQAEPTATNQTAEGREQNRRVEFFVE